MSLSPSVCPHGTTRLPLDGISSNFISEYFSKNCPEKSSFMNRTRIMSTLNEGQHTFLVISRSLVLRMKNASDKICRENQDTHLMFSNIFFFFENLAIYEVMWKNTVERGRPQMTIWRICIACWIPKATNTHCMFSNFFPPKTVPFMR